MKDSRLPFGPEDIENVESMKVLIQGKRDNTFPIIRLEALKRRQEFYEKYKNNVWLFKKDYPELAEEYLDAERTPLMDFKDWFHWLCFVKDFKEKTGVDR